MCEREREKRERVVYIHWFDMYIYTVRHKSSIVIILDLCILIVQRGERKRGEKKHIVLRVGLY